MSLNLETAILLQKNEIQCFAMGPFPNGYYGSVAYLMKQDALIAPILSVETGKFSTCKLAIDELDNVVKAVRELDLPSEKKELENIFE
jgi:hypothetical protein